MGKPLTLDFTLVEIVMLACSVLIVNFLVADCEANWLEGIMLLVSHEFKDFPFLKKVNGNFINIIFL